MDVICVIHEVCLYIQDSQKTPTPPDTQSDETTTSSNTDALIEALLAARKEAFSKAEENITAAQKKQKEEYDRKHQPKVQVGTVVLLENTMQKQRKGGKLEPLWLGPYTIHRDLGKGLYELSNQAGMVLKKKANIARLKEYELKLCILILKASNDNIAENFQSPNSQQTVLLVAVHHQQITLQFRQLRELLDL